MAGAPPPETLPGKVFALEWSRDREVFILHVQDADASSYNLGGDIPTVQMRFRLWGHADLGNRAIDIAREFGAVKASLVDGRAVAMFSRAAERKSKVIFEEETDGPHTLPTLRANL